MTQYLKYKPRAYDAFKWDGNKDNLPKWFNACIEDGIWAIKAITVLGQLQIIELDSHDNYIDTVSINIGCWLVDDDYGVKAYTDEKFKKHFTPKGCSISSYSSLEEE